MTAWALLWALIKHVLHGRGGDEVMVTVELDGGKVATGSTAFFTWAGDADAFCVIEVSGGLVEDVWEVTS